MKKPNITFKSLLQPIKDIKKRNEYFEYLSKEGKLLEIVWEALQMIVQETIRAYGPYNSRHYINTNVLNMMRKSESADKLQKNLLELDNCTVCARGGIMIARIRVGNKLEPNNSCIEDGSKNNTSDFIEYYNLEEIEQEFEFSTYEHPYEPRTNEKLMNIYCNILVNGYFNTDDKTDYLI